jgi:zinc finger protein
LTNVEGILSTIAQDLEAKQPERKEVMPEIFEKIEAVIQTLKDMATGSKFPFTITVDDPAGNSWIEPSTSDGPGKYTRHEYPRTAEQNIALGLAANSEEPEGVTLRPEYHPDHMVPAMPREGMINNVDDDEIIENQVYSFPASCPGCSKDCVTNMKMVNIPHFKQVIIMSTVCDHCGCKLSNPMINRRMNDVTDIWSQTAPMKSRLVARFLRKVDVLLSASIPLRTCRATSSNPSLAP